MELPIGCRIVARGNANRDKTKCPKGHEYSGDNLTIRKKDGARLCKACNKIKCIESYYLRKERTGITFKSDFHYYGSENIRPQT